MAVEAERAGLRAALLALDEEMRGIVGEAEALLEVLDSTGRPPVGLGGPLVDAEGFPRADVDVYAVRQQRNRLAVLRTDRKELEKRIERTLHDLHALGGAPDDPAAQSAAPAAAPVAPAAPARAAAEGPRGDDFVPIAVVNEVFDGSPASAAGLLAGDRVLRFGAVSKVAGTDGPVPQLADLGAEVSSRFGQPIEVVVLRRMTEVVSLSLTPRQWSGQGALGCHLLPIE